MNPKPITVLNAEDHTFVREGMRASLTSEPKIRSMMMIPFITGLD